MSKIFTNKIVLPLFFKYWGLPVKKVYMELDKTQWYSKGEIENYQINKVKKLLIHSCTNNSFYENHFRRYGVNVKDIQNFTDYKNIPVLTKKDLKENYLNGQIVSKGILKIVQKRHTSGTSGIPVSVWADASACTYSFAARYRSERWHGIHPGDSQGRLWGRSCIGFNRVKERINDALLNRFRLSASELNEKHMAVFYQQMIKNKTMFLYGYSSMLVNFANYLKSTDCNLEQINLKTIVSTAEEIFDFQKKEIQSLFGCPVVEEYGCSEVEIIAYECPHKNMHVLSENIYLEIIKEDENSPYGKVLITDLNNYLMPIIRYEIGDIGSIHDIECKCGRKYPIFKSALTRNQDQYLVTEDGKRIHSVIFPQFIDSLVSKEIRVKQFKIIQNSDFSIEFFIDVGSLHVEQKILQNLFDAFLVSNRLKGINCLVQIKDLFNETQVENKYSYFTTYL